MPIEIGIWRINGPPEKISFSSLATESKLEAVLDGDVSVLDAGLLLLGRQVPTASGKFIDLLAIDAQGDLVVVELKRNRTPREVVAQVLDYGSWVQSLSYDQVISLYAEHHEGAHLEKAFAERFEVAPPEQLNQNHRLLVVASELDNSTERIITYLSSTYGVPINAVFFRYFKEGPNEYLARTWLVDPNQAESLANASTKSKGSKEIWNGTDFYVSFGEGSRRRWEDAVRYGFVSAGGGAWYRATLDLLTPGARVFVHIPKMGYVGVGTVKSAAVPVTEFKVSAEGVETPILEAVLKAPDMGEFAGDPDREEYVVGVHWIKTLPVTQAVWEAGMFANQNSACKLRNKFTLERLSQRFVLSD